MADAPPGWTVSDDDSVVRFELTEDARRHRPAGVAGPGLPRRPGRHRWLLVAAAAGALAAVAVVAFDSGGADAPELRQEADQQAAVMPALGAETLPPPAVVCADPAGLAAIAARMPYDGGIDVEYRIAPDLATLVGRSRVVAAATIESMRVDGRFTVLELSRVHILTGMPPRTLARVAAPGWWTQERERVRFDGLRAVLFVHVAELVPGAEWIPDVQGIVIGCDGVDGTVAILEPLPPDADDRSIEALTRDVLTIGRNLER